MTSAPPPPSAPRSAATRSWTIVAGIVVASIGAVVAMLPVGAGIAIVAVFALAGDEPVVAIGYAAAWLVVAAAFLAALIAAVGARGWSRIVLALLAALVVPVAIAMEQAPVGSILVAVAVVLLSVPPSQRWFADRSRARTSVSARIGAPGAAP